MDSPVGRGCYNFARSGLSRELCHQVLHIGQLEIGWNQPALTAHFCHTLSPELQLELACGDVDLDLKEGDSAGH